MEPDWIACPECGLQQSCPSCKKPVEKTWVACPVCAHKLDQPPMIGKEKNAAAILTLERIKDYQDRIRLSSRPFYERFADSLPIKNWLFWILVGQLIMLGHYLLARTRGVNIFDDASWFLGIMIGLTMAFIDKSTKNLRKPFPIMFDIVDEPADEFGKWFMNHLSDGLKDRNMLGYGLLFGSINAALGHIYGVWYEDPVLILSITVQWFLIGFAAGLGFKGGIIIIKLTGNFGKKPLIFNSESIDGCGGSSYLGRKILFDAFLYFVVGLMVAGYVLSSPWENAQAPLIKNLIYSWIAFPYVCTLALFFMPINKIHQKLAKFKAKEQNILRARRKSLYLDLAVDSERCRLMEDAERETALKNLTDVVTELRQVSQMSTWPYNSRNLTQFFATLFIPIGIWFLENPSRFLSFIG